MRCSAWPLTTLGFPRRDDPLSGYSSAGFELTPTFREVNKRFSTRYYLNLVLIDEENRRYFKQQVRHSPLLLWLVANTVAVAAGDHNIQNTRSRFSGFTV